MKVLGIETATAVCAAAVVEDGRILSESSLEQLHVHSEVLMKQIDEVLTDTGSRLDALDGIAVSIGPGSFTGLRIGLGVAKGLSWATGTRLAAVPTLRAVARRALDTGGIQVPCLVLSALDARRGEVYCQLFQAGESGLTPVGDEQVMTLSALLVELGDREVVVAGDSSAFRAVAVGRERLRFLPASVARCTAGAVALEGEIQLRLGNTVSPGSIEPRYVMEFRTRTGVVT